MYNEFLKSIFDGYAAGKNASRKKYPERNNKIFDWLVNDKNPKLFSVAELEDLYEQAGTDYQVDCILEHLNRHDAWESDGYKRFEKKIINERWRG